MEGELKTLRNLRIFTPAPHHTKKDVGAQGTSTKKPFQPNQAP